MTFSKQQIGNIDGGKTALVLCGYGPFGDCQSIRHRLDAACAQMRKVTENANELAKSLPKDEFVKMWRREAMVWQFAINQGKKLLDRELRKLETL